MPHYADGTEAKVGDSVYGRLYNTTGIRAGTIISVTPGMETCNAVVSFIEAVPIDGDPACEWSDLERHWVIGGPLSGKVPRMATWSSIGGYRWPRFRVVQGQDHGASGSSFALFECADYCAVNELTKVG